MARLGGPFACAVACRMAWPIVTERLELRPYVIDDVSAIHAVLYGDPEAMRLIDGAVDLDETRRRIESVPAGRRHAWDAEQLYYVASRSAGGTGSTSSGGRPQRPA
jgi:RimJ/RimL family protein N-acetyltransferase